VKCSHLLGRRSISVCLGASLVVTAAVSTLVQAAEASGAPPAVNLSPSGNFSDSQTISVSVGPNSFFTPHAGVNILECADPGGSTANLPTDISACDGNSIQGTTVLVANNGSFSESSYQVYSLPSSTLGEQSNAKPICNQTNYCVLYVGQNQNDFTAPKTFSAPFLISPSSGTAGSTATGTGSAGTPGTSSGSAGTSSPSSSTSSTNAAPSTTAATGATPNVAASVTGASSLADTGPSAQLLWLAGSGTVLLLTGAVGRRRVLRRMP
jgi:hypothetical protein